MLSIKANQKGLQPVNASRSSYGFAAVATINEAIIALAKAFAEQGVKDDVQVNSVVPGPLTPFRGITPSKSANQKLLNAELRTKLREMG